MKKLVGLLFAVALIASVFTACDNLVPTDYNASIDYGVCTFPPPMITDTTTVNVACPYRYTDTTGQVVVFDPRSGKVFPWTGAMASAQNWDQLITLFR